MNDEIKEILGILRRCTYGNEVYLIKEHGATLLLDYITNLQQENERLKELDENYPIEEELAEAYRREEDYKSRIEKAINKVQDIIDIGFDYDGYNDVDNLKILVDELVDLARQTKNILNGKE